MIKKHWNLLKTEKASPILILFIVINITCLLVANIIAAKTFPVFTVGGITAMLPCAIITYPLVYCLSDLISQIYGYKWSRRTCWISFFMNLLMVGFFELAIIMPGETDLSVLKSTFFLLVASLVSFMFGGWINDMVFVKMKKTKSTDGFVGRCLLSSLCGQFCDSIIYIPLAMNILPRLFLGFEFMSWPQVIICTLLQPVIKVVYEAIVSPLMVLVCKKITLYENSVGNIYEL